jgi:hypothetical protein
MDALFESACGVGGLCDVLGVWIAALLTILVFTYLIRDTFLFRIASSLLVGTSVGFAGAVVIRNVLFPAFVKLFNDFFTSSDLFAMIGAIVIDALPLFLGITILFRLAAKNVRLTTLGNIGLAYLFGIGAALTIGGALAGILAPQIIATMFTPVMPSGNGFDWLNGIIIVVGTIGAFLAFRFIQPGNSPWQRAYDTIVRGWGTIGRGFIMIAFGAILANLILARVSALVGQLYFLLHDWLSILK